MLYCKAILGRGHPGHEMNFGMNNVPGPGSLARSVDLQSITHCTAAAP